MIVVCGDSWACVQWESTGNASKVTDLGLAGFLLANDRTVLNLGQPAANEIDIYKRLRDLLQLNWHLDITSAIVFQTEITRSPWFLHPSWQDGWFESRDKLVWSWYDKLDALGSEHDLQILLIGGVGECACPEQVSDSYSNLKVACQSLTNLLLFDDPNCAHPALSIWDQGTHLMVEQMKEKSTTHELQDLIEQIDLGHRRVDQWRQNKQWFYPDGMHPNKQAHEKLYHFLVKNFNL